MLNRLKIGNKNQTNPIYKTYRNPEDFAAYQRQMEQATAAKDESCVLCSEARIVTEDFGLVKVIQNDFPYAVYQSLPVKEHLMVIPARHVAHLSDLTFEEAAVYWRACAKYSQSNYTLFTQAATGSQRSVQAHVHTHLVLCDDDKATTDV